MCHTAPVCITETPSEQEMLAVLFPTLFFRHRELQAVLRYSCESFHNYLLPTIAWLSVPTEYEDVPSGCKLFAWSLLGYHVDKLTYKKKTESSPQ